jgi:molybdopterin synthase sulfur carrier subunit
MIGLQVLIRKPEKVLFMTTNAIIRVKFFASLREQVGQAEAEVAKSEVETVADVWKQTTNNMALPDNTLMAVNMEYVDASQLLKAGDEVAFFPPVTGG